MRAIIKELFKEVTNISMDARELSKAINVPIDSILERVNSYNERDPYYKSLHDGLPIKDGYKIYDRAHIDIVLSHFCTSYRETIVMLNYLNKDSDTYCRWSIEYATRLHQLH